MVARESIQNLKTSVQRRKEQIIVDCETYVHTDLIQTMALLSTALEDIEGLKNRIKLLENRVGWLEQ